jgi:hypothetical protein
VNHHESVQNVCNRILISGLPDLNSCETPVTKHNFSRYPYKRKGVLGRKHEIQVLKCDVSFIDIEYVYKFIGKKVLLLIILILTEIHNKI